MELRKITEEERAAFVRLSRYAFHDWSDEEVKEDYLAWADPESVIGVFEEGKLVSGLKCFAADQSVRGVVKAMGGISCVVTAPAYRDRGFAREVMRAAFNDMKVRDLVVSMLRPFRETFYERLGYVSANSAMTVGFPTGALRRWLSFAPPPGWRLDVAPTLEGLEELKAFWRAEVLGRNHGMIYVRQATESEWKLWAKDTLTAFAKKDGNVRGLARFKKSGFGGEGKLEVPEFFWADADARDLLLHFLARHRDQVGEVKLCLPYGTRFQPWLEDASRPLETKVFHLPWMVRVMDVGKALDGLPAGGPGEVAVEVVDEQCEWNNGRYTLRAEDGRIRVAKGEGRGDLRMDIKALSALTYGTLPTAELARRGWLAGGDAASRELLAKWFTCKFIFNTVDF